MSRADAVTANAESAALSIFQELRSESKVRFHPLWNNLPVFF